MSHRPLLQSLALLERTPEALDALLRGLPDDWTHREEGPGTWTVSDVITHLVHTERTNWMPRVRAIMQGDGVFPAYDRHAFERATDVPITVRLDQLRQLRREGLDELRAMPLRAVDLERPGHHPTVGPVSLSQVLAAWVVHDLTHLHQISRVMAHQYRDATGPWRQFLGVLRCEGHGD